MVTRDFEQQTRDLIDSLKAVCAHYGLGNDGNEFKIITQVFLYKFLNDKFAHEVKQIDETLRNAEKWEQALQAMRADDFEMLQMQLGPNTARLQPDQLITALFEQHGCSVRSNIPVLALSRE